MYNLLLMVFEAAPLAMKGDNAVDGNIVSGFIDENIARSEGRADDDEAQRLREALRSKSGIQLLPTAEYLQS